MTTVLAKDGLIRFVLVRKGEYAILRAEVIRDGVESAINIDRYKNPSRIDLAALRRKGTHCAKVKRVKFVDEIVRTAIGALSDVKDTKDHLLAYNHPCVRP